MENHVEEVYLRPWQEVVGVCTAVIQTDANTKLVIESKERVRRWKVTVYGYTRELNYLVGKPIAILRTDSIKRPFIIRELAASAAIDPTASIASEASTPIHNIFSKREDKNEKKKE